MNLVIEGNRHPDTLAFGPLFDSGHMTPALAAVAEPFIVCARATIDQVPDGDQLKFALQSLLVAKDAAVRGALAGARPVVVTDPPSPELAPRALPVDDVLTAAAAEGAAGSGLAGRG